MFPLPRHSLAPVFRSAREFAAVGLLLLVCLPAFGQIFAAGSGVADPEGTARIDLLFDSQDESTVAQGLLRLGFDPAVIQLTESCRSRIGGTIVSSHRISCDVDNQVGTFTIEFTPVTPMVPQSLVGRYGLGHLLVTLVDSATVPQDGVRQLLPTQLITLSNLSGFPLPTSTPLAEGEAIFLPGWPVDRFELDDSPVVASNLDDSLLSNGDPFIFQQLHSLDSATDEDWSVHVRDVCNPTFAELRLSSLDALPAADFHPLVQIYPISRLRDSTVFPDAVLGNCDGAPGEQTLDVTALFQESRLIRVTSCQPVPAEGLAYRLIRSLSLACPSESVAASGTVTDALSGQPVQAVVFATPNQLGVSNPVTGQYQIALLAGQAYTLTVVSDQFQSNAITIGPFQEGTRDTGNNLFVIRKSEDVFADSFEPLNNLR